mmetsp:Transcript_29825/g.96220  ORF Transcript_29825/g.96220 Transcript_29825/m.96220 type:complete len:230 (+) Transcript_29825:805-1494(+)
MVPLPAGTTKKHGVAVAAEVAAVLAEVLAVELAGGQVSSAGRVVDDPRLASNLGSLLQQRVELLRQQEVGEVVRLHLDVVAVDGGLVHEGHDAGVVAQNVERVRQSLYLRHRGLDRPKVHEVTVDVDPAGDLLDGLLRPLARPVQHQHLGPLRSACLRGDEPCARRTPRDRHDLALQPRQRRLELTEPHRRQRLRRVVPRRPTAHRLFKSVRQASSTTTSPLASTTNLL